MVICDTIGKYYGIWKPRWKFFKFLVYTKRVKLLLILNIKKKE